MINIMCEYSYLREKNETTESNCTHMMLNEL